MSEAEDRREEANLIQPLSKQLQPIHCPLCGNTNNERICRSGIRYLAGGKKVQRFQCKICGHRFSETSIHNSNMFQHVQKIHTKSLNYSETLSSNRQGHDDPYRRDSSADGAVQTLTEVESRVKEASGRAQSH